MRRHLFFLPVFLVIASLCKAQTAEEYYQQGITLKEEKKPKEALVAFQEATKRDPGKTAAWYEMGWVSNDLKEYINAIIYLRKAALKWPTVPKVHFELGYAFEKTDRYDSAIDHYKRCLELKPDYSLAHKQLGTIAYYKEEYVSSLEYFAKYESYAKSEIRDYLYWYRKGFMLNAQKKYSEAIIALDKSKAIKTDYINTHLELGFASSRLKQNDIAIAHYTTAISLEPKSHIGYNGIGEVYRDNIKNREEAMKWYQKALDITSNERKALFGIGYCLNSLGKYSEAIPYLKSAIEQESTYTAAHVELGYSNYILKNYSTALESFNTALKLNSANENARYYSVLVYVAQKNKTQAQKIIDELKGLNSKYVTELQDKVNKM